MLFRGRTLKEVPERRATFLWTVAIVAISAGLGLIVDWRAPGIERYTRDWLMRLRGPLPVPDDIAIVAIDERSIARFGRFPWPRSLAAHAVDAIAAAQPKVVALDILYTDPTTPAEDEALARSVARAGNVVVAAQLVDAPASGGPATWLLPLPPLAASAAATGHVNVTAESEGIARQLFIRAADDSGRVFRSMAVEAIRIADRTPEQAVTDTPHAVLVGSRVIPVDASAPTLVISGAAQTFRAGRMTIDYIGPAGAFAPCTYSLADVLDGGIPVGSLHGKYVLVGATAASMGDRIASPFVHQTDVRGDEHGALMPGVEVLANAVNTILRSRFYSDTPDWLAFLCAALIAALTLLLLAVAQGGREVPKQIGVLAGMGAGILVAGDLLFTRFLVFPPLVPSVVSFASAGILGLLRRSLVTSGRLDSAIADLTRAGAALAPGTSPDRTAETIAQLTGASAVAIFAAQDGRYRFFAGYGARAEPAAKGVRAVAVSAGKSRPARFYLTDPHPEQPELLVHPLGDSATRDGILVIAHAPGHRPSSDVLQLAATIARAAAPGSESNGAGSRWSLPRGVEWKASSLARLNQRILARARFFDSAVRSVEDGLIIAGADGRITLVNRRAAGILGAGEPALIGRNLFERLAEAEGAAPAATSELLTRLLIDRAPIEREITIRGTRARRYILRIAAVSEGEGQGSVLGIVASLSDITRQHELQQTKNDVMALVSHEMRTPLSAIQGMSELLAQYDLEPARRKEMTLAINDEVKRLTRMITEYLDITRLESGATVLRRLPVRVDALVERSLLMLDPLAQQKHITIARKFDADLPAVLADPDLLARAAGNLVSNAVKYSPEHTQVTVAVRSAQRGIAIEVADQGRGIPASDLDRIFEKFYRVPRLEDADTPGTGLGLALVREIAELHGGSVTVTSEPGAGSRFTLQIPREEENKE